MGPLLHISIMGQYAVTPAGLSSGEASPGAMSALGGMTYARLTASQGPTASDADMQGAWLLA